MENYPVELIGMPSQKYRLQLLLWLLHTEKMYEKHRPSYSHIVHKSVEMESRPAAGAAVALSDKWM